MSKRVLSIALAAAFAVTAVATPVAAAPKGDDIKSEFDPVPDVICDGNETLEVARTGWLKFKAWGYTYKVRLAYTNTEGETWRYVDAGILKGISVSGRSTNAGPGGTGWVGRAVFEGDGVVTRHGRETGDLDQRACDALTG